jgi:hypothetical protein
MSDKALMKKGMQVLIDNLGDVEAEKFVSILLREPFDYTQWREDNLCIGMAIEEISSEAMKIYNHTHP